MEPLRIGSEADAWVALEKALRGEFGADFGGLEFNEWPVINLHLTGPKFHGTMTTSVMESFIDLQKNLNRSYARLQDKSDARNLTDEDREQIEIVVKVKDGTSDLTAALANALEKVAVTVGDKMEPHHLITMVLGLALTYFGHSYFKARLDATVKEKGIDADKNAKEEDTKRFALMADVIKKNPVMATIRDDAEDSHAAMFKAISTAEKADFMGMEIQQDVARKLITSKRERSKDVRLDGEYTVVVADNSIPGDPRCRLVNMQGETFPAMIVDEHWTPRETELFQVAFWKGTPVGLKVNAKKLRDQVLMASIVGVDVPQE